MSDEAYLDIFLAPILVSKEYRPKLGDARSAGYSLADFLELYGADPFYAWIGLDSDLMYAAHRAAGGMTSLYRQIGIGCENLFRQIIADVAQYAAELDADIPNNGIVFEVRQGYKSKDSKRQNADIDNATVAWSKGYLPVFAIFSRQIDSDIVLRYRNSRSGILMGILSEDASISLYAFMERVIGYDLAGFFERNSQHIRQQVLAVIQTLLSAE